jgi:hypothetical protein
VAAATAQAHFALPRSVVSRYSDPSGGPRHGPVLGHPDLDSTDLSSLQCFWYGAAPMSVARLEEALNRIAPVMAQLFGADRGADDDLDDAAGAHFGPDGTLAGGILDDQGREQRGGERARSACAARW